MCNWTPELLVELVKVSAWPLVVLILGLGFRIKFSEAIKDFLSRNSISKLSATSTGVYAEFVASKQSDEVKEGAGKNVLNLPDHMSASAIQERHELNKSEFSEEQYIAIKTHLAAMNLSAEVQTELLCKELSIMQSALRFFDVSKVMFRSQFNLFSVMANNGGYMSESDVQRYFTSVKSSIAEGISDWDWIKYLSYPSSAGLISSSGDGYSLTVFGKSYVEFMSKNPQFIDDLAKL